MITLSVIKADIGGFPGHSAVHPSCMKAAEAVMAKAKKKRLLKDYRVMACGDDLPLLHGHFHGPFLIRRQRGHFLAPADIGAGVRRDFRQRALNAVVNIPDKSRAEGKRKGRHRPGDRIAGP